MSTQTDMTEAETMFAAVRKAEARQFPIVETAEGKVRGLSSGRIASFKGLRYAADTAGANRFGHQTQTSKTLGRPSTVHDSGVLVPQAGQRREGDGQAQAQRLSRSLHQPLRIGRQARAVPREGGEVGQNQGGDGVLAAPAT